MKVPAPACGVRYFISVIMSFGFKIIDDPQRQCKVTTAGMLLTAGIQIPELRRHAIYYLSVHFEAAEQAKDGDLSILLGATLGATLDNPEFWEEKNIV